MNWDQIAGNWKQLTGKVKENWGKLTDDDLTTIAGKRDQLAGVLACSRSTTGSQKNRQRRTSMISPRRLTNELPCSSQSARFPVGGPMTNRWSDEAERKA